VYLFPCLPVHLFTRSFVADTMGELQERNFDMSIESVQDGVVVSIEYTLHVDGELLDSSDGQGPLQFLAGYGNIVPGLENEMMGMKVGESKKVVVQPVDGYGEFDEEAFMQ